MVAPLAAGRRVGARTATTSTADTPKSFRQPAGGCARLLNCFAVLSEGHPKPRPQHKPRNTDMARKDRPTDPAEIQLAIEEAIQHFVRKGWIVDSGHKRWSQRTGRYEIVWESKVAGKTFD